MTTERDALAWERAAALIGLIAIATTQWALGNKTSPGVYIFNYHNFLDILTLAWLISSITYKTLVLGGQNVKLLGISSITCFMVLVIAVAYCVTPVVPYERPFFYEVTAFISMSMIIFVDLLNSLSPD